MITQENFTAHIHGLLGVGAGELVQEGTLQRFNTVDVAVHTCVEPLVSGYAGNQLGVHDDLIEYCVVRVQTQFTLRAAQYRGT